jgi:uncharacterized protein (DUF608 family)
MSRSQPFEYDGEHASEISFPLGGIGTGSLGLSGAGRLVDWEILNRPNKGSMNGLSHFAVKAESAGTVLDARLLHGPYRGSRMGDFPADTARNFGFGARRDALAGMPHFTANTFTGTFPTARLGFQDEHFPGRVELLAFNPLIPHNDRDSSMPAAMFEISFTNTSTVDMDYTAVGVLGHGLPLSTRAGALGDGRVWGVSVVTDETLPSSPDHAEIVLATDADETSSQVHLYRGHWFDSLEVYWRDLNRPGRFAARDYRSSDPLGGMGRNRDGTLLSARVSVPPGETRVVRMVIAWYAPVFRKYWVSPLWHFRQVSHASGEWPNWYASQWGSAAEVAREVLDRWDELRAATEQYREALYTSTLPSAVLDAVGANVSILKSPTVLRLADGTFYGWEGCHPNAGSCEGSCTHVWNYQQVLPFLFPALERSMREADYRYNLNDAGAMSFRLSLPLGTRFSTERPCADGQFGNVLKVYRDWKLSGDTEWLGKLWTQVRRSIEYAWSPENPDNWDPDQTGVLWGRQHHTLDMELFGPNSWLTGFYLGALKAGAELARAMGDDDTAVRYAAIYERGRAWVDRNLFNGEHFIQAIDLANKSILDPFVSTEVAHGVLGDSVEQLYWSREHGQLKYQAGEACLVDQLLGQWHARLYGLGELFEPDKTVTTLKSIFRHNFVERLGDIYNPCRVFGLYDESGTVIATWPDPERRPAVPVPYAQETMHGMEYAFGSLLMSYGLVEEGVRVYAAVRDRYDGRHRNPWNEIECGSNYARSMASWAAVVVLSGFTFDMTRGHIGFDPKVQLGRVFSSLWSGPGAYGTVAFRDGSVVLRILGGDMALSSLGLPGLDADVTVELNGRPVAAQVRDRELCLDAVSLTAGDELSLASQAFTVAGLPDAGGL